MSFRLRRTETIQQLFESWLLVQRRKVAIRFQMLQVVVAHGHCLFERCECLFAILIGCFLGFIGGCGRVGLGRRIGGLLAAECETACGIIHVAAKPVLSRNSSDLYLQ